MESPLCSACVSVERHKLMLYWESQIFTSQMVKLLLCWISMSLGTSVVVRATQAEN